MENTSQKGPERTVLPTKCHRHNDKRKTPMGKESIGHTQFLWRSTDLVDTDGALSTEHADIALFVMCSRSDADASIMTNRR